MSDLAGSQKVLCLSHAADAVRQVDHLSIVPASRSSRAFLAEVRVRPVSSVGEQLGWRRRTGALTVHEDDVHRLPAVVDLVTAAGVLGIGRTTAYEMVRTGRWPTPVLRLGNRIRVPTAALRELLSLSTESSEVQAPVAAER